MLLAAVRAISLPAVRRPSVGTAVLIGYNATPPHHHGTMPLPQKAPRAAAAPRIIDRQGALTARAIGGLPQSCVPCKIDPVSATIYYEGLLYWRTKNNRAAAAEQQWYSKCILIIKERSTWRTVAQLFSCITAVDARVSCDRNKPALRSRGDALGLIY